MTTPTEKLLTESLAYPSGAPMKYVYKLPIVLYRLGLGALVGQLFMILTTTGRKSGLPRRTAIEFHQHKGRKYVMVGWKKSDWYQIGVWTKKTMQTAGLAQSARTWVILRCRKQEAHEYADRSTSGISPKGI
jgi:hypothetical protein